MLRHMTRSSMTPILLRKEDDSEEGSASLSVHKIFSMHKLLIFGILSLQAHAFISLAPVPADLLRYLHNNFTEQYTSIAASQIFPEDWNSTLAHIDSAYYSALDNDSSGFFGGDKHLNVNVLAGYLKALQQAYIHDAGAYANITAASDTQLQAAAASALSRMTGRPQNPTSTEFATPVQFSRYVQDILTHEYSYYPALCTAFYEPMTICGQLNNGNIKSITKLIKPRVEMVYEVCNYGVTAYSNWKVERCALKSLECDTSNCTNPAELTIDRCMQASQCFLEPKEAVKYGIFYPHPQFDATGTTDFASLQSDDLVGTLILEAVTAKALRKSALKNSLTYRVVDTSIAALIFIVFTSVCPECMLVICPVAIVLYILTNILGWFLVNLAYPRSIIKDAGLKQKRVPDLFVMSPASAVMIKSH